MKKVRIIPSPLIQNDTSISLDQLAREKSSQSVESNFRSLSRGYHKRSI